MLGRLLSTAVHSCMVSHSAPENTVVEVENRKARVEYGMSVTVIYNMELHYSRYWDACVGDCRAEVMEWFVRRVS